MPADFIASKQTLYKLLWINRIRNKFLIKFDNGSYI